MAESKTHQRICAAINHKGKEMPVAVDGKIVMVCPLCGHQRPL